MNKPIEQEARLRQVTHGLWPTSASSLLLPLVCLLPVLLYLPILAAPFDRDEGVYSTLAQGILRGELPYRDLFDHKTPLVYLWYALSFLLLGEHLAAPRILAALASTATTYLVFQQSRAFYDSKTAYISAALFAASTCFVALSALANTEVFMLLPLVASVLAYTTGLRTHGMRWFLLSGILLGLAIMTKQVAIWNLLALAAFLPLWSLGRSDTHWCRALLMLTCGSGLVLAATIAAFTLFGALDDFLYANWTYNTLYARHLAFTHRMSLTIWSIAIAFVITAPLTVLAGVGLKSIAKKRKIDIASLIAFCLVASFLGAITSGYGFLHYFVPLGPFAAIIGAPVLLTLRPRPTPALAVAIALTTASFLVNAAFYSSWQRVDETRLLGRYLEARTESGQTIYNFGHESQLYFYSDRRPAARIFYNQPFIFDEVTLQVTLSELKARKPAYVVDTTVEPSETLIATMTAGFHRFLDENYEYEGRLYSADIYRLKTQ